MLCFATLENAVIDFYAKCKYGLCSWRTPPESEELFAVLLKIYDLLFKTNGKSVFKFLIANFLSMLCRVNVIFRKALSQRPIWYST